MITERYDICECGDYRHQHKGGGQLDCTLCGSTPSPSGMCRQFRLWKRMAATWTVTR